MRISKNNNPAGKVINTLHGLAEIVDGVVRLISLGWLHTDFVVSVARWQARRPFNGLRKRLP